MAWDVEITDECADWYRALPETDQDEVAVIVGLLEQYGPQLPFPYSSGITSSAHGHMRELRIQSRGDPVRILYAFDPRRTAILLVGGKKTGDDRWYESAVPEADRLYQAHLETLRKEKLI